MSWLLVFLGFSLLIVLHELGHFLAAKATGMRVERFFLFFPAPKLVSVKHGETEYGIGAIPVGGMVKISGMYPDEELPPEVEHRAYCRQAIWKRIVVIGAGPAVNILLAFAILIFLAFEVANPNNTIGSIEPNSPAAAAHLRPGDKILSVDNHAYLGVGSTTRLTRISKDIASHKCVGQPTQGCRAATPALLRIKRGQRVRMLSIRPAYDSSLQRTRVGFTFGSTPADPSLSGAISSAWHRMWFVSSRTFKAVTHVFEPKQRQQISGIVGVSDVGHQLVDQGYQPALLLLAVVSLSLGLINLLPFLPLDGGHIFWSLVEKVRGRPVSLRVMTGASAFGFVLVAMLMFIGLTNDIGRLSGSGFHLR